MQTADLNYYRIIILYLLSFIFTLEFVDNITISILVYGQVHEEC